MARPVIPLVVKLTVEQNDNVYALGANEVIRIVENDYNPLINKPSINGVTLIGDLSLEDLITSYLRLDCGTSTTVID